MQAEASFLDQDASQPTYAVLARVSPGYPPLPGRLPTCYSPVRRSPGTEAPFAHDLHVLSTPPAFILSQDQTLHLNLIQRPRTEILGRLKKNLDLLYESKQKLCLLREKTEKTSGTLYSVFKEPDPGFHRGRAVPPAQLTDNLRPETEISAYGPFSARSTKTCGPLQ